MVLKYCITTHQEIIIDEHYRYLDELLKIATRNHELHDLALEMYYSKNVFCPYTDEDADAL